MVPDCAAAHARAMGVKRVTGVLEPFQPWPHHLDLPHLPADRVRAAAQHSLFDTRRAGPHGIQLQAEKHEPLAKVIVQFSGDPAALLLLRLQ